MDSTPQDIAVGGWVSLGFRVFIPARWYIKVNAAPPPSIKCKGGWRHIQASSIVGTWFANCRACYPTTHPALTLLGFSAALAPKLTHTILRPRGVSLQDYVFSKNSGALWYFLELFWEGSHRNLDYKHAKIAKTYENDWFLYVLEALMHASVHPKLFRFHWISHGIFRAWAPRFKVLYNT